MSLYNYCHCPQVFPGNLLQHNYPNPDNPDQLLGRNEVERRGNYFDQLYRLLQLMKDCLHNVPSRRPTAEQLVTSLEEMKGEVEGAYGELATVDAVRQVRTVKALKAKGDVLAEKDLEIQHLREQLGVMFMASDLNMLCSYMCIL